MKKIGLLLILLSLFIAACGSGGTEVAEPVESEEQAAAPTSQATSEPVAEPDSEVDDTAIASTDDVLYPRERDWKLGNTTDPAVTIIEYGDFQ
jgi:hypothetical protein